MGKSDATQIGHSSRAGRLVVAFSVLVVSAAMAQRAPRVGYVYPAGGQQGTNFEILIGGQGLDDPTGVLVSGGDVTSVVLEHDKPLSAVRAGDVSDRLAELQQRFRADPKAASLPPNERLAFIRQTLKELEITEKDLRLLADYDRKRNDPKRQQNTQIGETVRVRLTIAEGAQAGTRFLRLRTQGGLSNPMRFEIGQHPEVRETEPPVDYFDLDGRGSGRRSVNSYQAAVAKPVEVLPATINGRIMPGEVDAFTFHARAGTQLVLMVRARNLIPYLADAVPGWFQAVATLYDSSGKEVAFSDDYGFDPDPVMFYKIPADGDYRIEVRDSIYRGREDFVYRITLGELPFLTAISPLGGTVGSTLDVSLFGGNLGTERKIQYAVPDKAGITYITAHHHGWTSNAVPFHASAYPEENEREQNNTLGSANEVKLPVIVNGRIDSPGDVDFYRVKGRGGQPMAFEIFARRLNTPVDATLTVFDTDGNQIAFNDDHEDPGSGLTTHHADSNVFIKLPKTGECFVRVADAQHQSGPGNLYRLRLSMAEEGFALRVTPSSLNAASGGAARLTAHVLRLDGYEGEITLSARIKSTGKAIPLNNAVIAADQNDAEVSFTVPSSGAIEEPVELLIQGTAKIGGRTVVVDAVPAEDMMQAFIYKHLVPVDDLLLDVHVAPPKKEP